MGRGAWSRDYRTYSAATRSVIQVVTPELRHSLRTARLRY